MILELWQGWCCDHFHGEPVPVVDNPLSEESFANVQAELPLMHLQFISSCLIAGHQREEISTSPTAATLEEAADCDEVTPQPSLLQAAQNKWPQPLLISLALQTFRQLGCPPLDTLIVWCPSYVEAPKLDTVLEVRLHECSVEWNGHLPWLPSYAVLGAPQDMVSPSGCQGTLLSHI